MSSWGEKDTQWHYRMTWVLKRCFICTFQFTLYYALGLLWKRPEKLCIVSLREWQPFWGGFKLIYTGLLSPVYLEAPNSAALRQTKLPLTSNGVLLALGKQNQALKFSLSETGILKCCGVTNFRRRVAPLIRLLSPPLRMAHFYPNIIRYKSVLKWPFIFLETGWGKKYYWSFSKCMTVKW